MKSLLKIIFFGIIAGLTWKYLNERDINIAAKSREAFEWIAREAKEIKNISDKETSYCNGNENDSRSQGETSGPVSSYFDAKPYREEPQGNYEQEINVPEQPKSSPLPDTEETEAEEFIIPGKPFTGTPRFPELDEYAKNIASASEASLQTLAASLIRPASNDLEKTRTLFTWIATHIAYDDNGFNTGNYSDMTAEGVLRNRVSVCQGYSNLFQALGKLAGLEIVTITGNAKGITYQPGQSLGNSDHAWNAVRIDGKWKLFDVTWAAGYGRGVNGKLVSVRQFDDYWFDTRPDEFIFSHFPEDDSWQLNEVRISKYQFEKLPYVSSLYFKMGFNGSYCFPAALNGTISELPVAYNSGGDIKIESLPYDRKISPGKLIKVRIRSGNAVKIAFRNNGRITDMTRVGNEFTAIVRTTPGSLSLMANFEDNSMTYQTFLEYVVE